MSPVAIALMTVPLTALAAWSIMKSLAGAGVGASVWNPYGPPNPVGFAVFLTSRLMVVAFGAAEGLHALGLVGDPLRALAVLLRLV